jgi:serine/threonine protein kinase
MTDSPKRTKKFFIAIVSKILNISSSDISHLGTGTYSYVFSIPGNKVIKVYHDEKTYKNEYRTDSDYFDAATFREIFFNSFLEHENLYKYNEIKYDQEMGLYLIGQQMIDCIDNDFIINNFNEEMFFRLLDDMVEALLHLHSYGIIHSDIKPGNILYSKNKYGNMIFKLCDFNISQFCSVVSHDTYKVFTTPHFCDSRETRSLETDIYMLGATLLCTILKKNNKSINLKPLTMNLLLDNHQIIIKQTSEVCYKILRLMMLPQQNRIYLHHLRNFVDQYNYRFYTNDSLNNSLDHYLLTKNTEKGQVNTMEMQIMCHERVYKTIHRLSLEDLKIYKNLHRFDTIFEKKFNKRIEKLHLYSDGKNKEAKECNEYDVLCELLTFVIMNYFNAPEQLAGFIAQSLCYFPEDATIKTWIDETENMYDNVNVEDINKLSLDICLSEVQINLHLLLCSKCRSECYNYFQEMNLCDSLIQDTFEYTKFEHVTNNTKEKYKICTIQ